MEEYIKSAKALIDAITFCADSFLEFGAQIEQVRESKEYRQVEIYEQFFAPMRSDN